jgi:hypothetical protein
MEWTLKKVQIKDLREHAKNPRQIDKTQSRHLESMIVQFGLIDRPIVNQDLSIIGGHQRVRILKKMKTKEVECWMPDRTLSEKEIDRLCIGLNLNQGSWDYDILANQWDVIDLLQYGFTEEQLLGVFDKDGENVEEDKKNNNSKKKKTCPNCGHEF